MQNHLLFSILALLALTSAVPLNINLGAYSPALVVGDGEISFTGKQDVTTLMNALEGAAVSAAANNAAAAPAAAPATEVGAKGVVASGNAPSTSPAVTAPPVDPNTAAIAAMQTGVGLGNDLEPRGEAAKTKRDVLILSKRDLSGFDRALNYATAALKTSPGVQLGSGEGGSGVGISQLPGGQAAVAPKAAKRAVKARRNRITTLLARGVDFDDEVSKRDVAKLQQRSPSDEVVEPETELPELATRVVDSVNLNVKEGRGLLLRFVEEGGEDDDE